MTIYRVEFGYGEFCFMYSRSLLKLILNYQLIKNKKFKFFQKAYATLSLC